jgi:hypothetical protein
MASCGTEQVSASWTQRSRSKDLRRCQSVFNLQKSPLGNANMVAKKKKKEIEKRVMGKMTGGRFMQLDSIDPDFLHLM